MGYSFSPVSCSPGTPGSSGLSLQSSHPREGTGHAVSAKGMGTCKEYSAGALTLVSGAGGPDCGHRSQGDQ